MRSVVIFGSAISCSAANGATLFFRGLGRALARRGLQTIFAEEARALVPDGELPVEIRLWRYSAPSEVRRIIDEAAPPRLLLKFVECGPGDPELEEEILSHRGSSDRVLFVDGDAPATLQKIQLSPEHPLRRTLPRFDGVLVLAGGRRAAREYLEMGARGTHWGYCGVDEEFWHPVPPSPDWECDLLFVGNRLPDREARVEEFFFRPARLCPSHRFLLAGSGWEGVELPPNVRPVGHLGPRELCQAYSSAGLVLNVNREPMARYGYSPASRLFEAASCGACMVTDRWPGVGRLFAPGEEIVVASGAVEVAAAVEGLSAAVRHRIGLGARLRVVRSYSCDRWVDRLFEEKLWSGISSRDR